MLSKKLRFEVLKRDSFQCQYCGSSAPVVLLQVDHIKPVADGGTDDLWNLVAACQPCNSGKSDRKLSDQATVAKAKRQLDELQERREQLEMLMEWQRGLVDLKQEVIDEVADFYKSTLKGEYYLNEVGRERLGKLIGKYSAEAVLRAITSSTSYLEVGRGGYTAESVEVFFAKIGAICEVERRTGGDEDLKQLYYIRGIARKKVLRESSSGYFDDVRAFDYLETAVKCGVPLEALKRAAIRISNWSQFQKAVWELIDEATPDA